MIGVLSLPLETERFVLREFAESDRESIEEIYADPLVIKYVGTSPFAPRGGETAEGAFRRVRTGSGRPAAISTAVDDVVGAFSVQPYMEPDSTVVSDEVEVTLALVERARGEGIGGAVFGVVLGALRTVPAVRQVIARVSPCNKPSLRLVQSHGFTIIAERANLWLGRPDAVFALALR